MPENVGQSESWRGSVFICGRCGLQDPADCGRTEGDCAYSTGVEVEVMPVAEHEAEAARLRAACRHVIANCYCQPSGQHCDVCLPAALALMKEEVKS